MAQVAEYSATTLQLFCNRGWCELVREGARIGRHDEWPRVDVVLYKRFASVACERRRHFGTPCVIDDGDERLPERVRRHPAQLASLQKIAQSAADIVLGQWAPFARWEYQPAAPELAGLFTIAP